MAEKEKEKKDDTKKGKKVAVVDEKKKIIPGIGLTREQLVDYLKGKKEEGELRPSFMRYFHDITDWMNEGALITETPARMIVPKVRMKIILAAADPKRTKPLIQIFLEEYNREMIGFERKGRLEGLGALQALIAEGDEERAISIGR